MSALRIHTFNQRIQITVTPFLLQELTVKFVQSKTSQASRMLDNCPLDSTEVKVDDQQDENATDEITAWQESLYKIVISIVRILRIEFEANNQHVEIDLVIYFYELLLVNIDNLAQEDSVNIAHKLMPVLIKINNWRAVKLEEEVDLFTVEQSNFLHHMSFRLVDKFMEILGVRFISEEHLKEFTPDWIAAIKDWVGFIQLLERSGCLFSG